VGGCSVDSAVAVVVALVVAVCMFSEGLKWTSEKVVCAEVGWVKPYVD